MPDPRVLLPLRLRGDLCDPAQPLHLSHPIYQLLRIPLHPDNFLSEFERHFVSHPMDVTLVGKPCTLYDCNLTMDGQKSNWYIERYDMRDVTDQTV